MIAALRWIPFVYSVELRKALAYRIDFWVQVIASVITEMVIVYFLWQAIYASRGTTEMGGFTFGAIMLYYLLAHITSKVLHGPDFGFMSVEIYEGSLTRYLVYPVSFHGYKLAAYLAKSSVAILQLFVLLIAYLSIFGQPEGVTLVPSSLLMGVVAIVSATCLYFSIAAILETVAFWADNVWSLAVMLRFATALLGGALIPLTLFPESAQRVLAWLPFAYLIKFPVETMMGRHGLIDWLLGLGVCTLWTAVFLAIGWYVWRRGLKQYSGVGV
ncbi:MAG TPA: ABC-2 family transporter protein [Bdellovibrionota bacterium]|nr:ABC-2 family transporter protein [Bdellovibrionota bacterium]